MLARDSMAVAAATASTGTDERRPGSPLGHIASQTTAEPMMGVLALTATGDREEFADVFAAHHAEALRLAYLLTGDRHRAEDVVADAFVKVLRRWEKGRIDAPRAYIKRAVVNEANSRFRRLALERREAAKRSGDDRGGRSADEQIADSDQLFAALQRLPERQRTAVVLRYYQDLPEAEIAEVMGVSVGTVKSSVHRGMARLRTIVTEEVA